VLRTFIAALRHDGLTAPWVIKGAIDRDLFNAYVETQLAPALKRRDVVILDNLSSQKSAHAAECLASAPDTLDLQEGSTVADKI